MQICGCWAGPLRRGGSVGLFSLLLGAVVGEHNNGFNGAERRGKAKRMAPKKWGDQLRLLEKKVKEALEYTKNYEDASKNTSGFGYTIPLDRFVRDRIEDALMHAGFVVPTSGNGKKTNWRGIPFDVVGLSSKYLVLGDTRWVKKEIKVGEIISFLNRARKVRDGCKDKELALVFAVSGGVSNLAKETFESFPGKKLLISLN
jgi:hypothetical protein